MLRATSVKPKGSWNGTAADSVVLDYDDRHRRRTAMTGVQGTGFLLDLADAVLLRGGDALALDDGRLIEVVAAPEPLAEIRAESPAELVRIAWHLGNRHLPTQMAGNKLRIRRDYVIEAMVRGLGARVTEIEAPFDPEGGAYASGPQEHDGPDHHDPGHRHEHGDGSAHRHDHGHGHGHEHDHHHGHDHEHGQPHDHEHHHDHEHAGPGHRHGGR